MRATCALDGLFGHSAYELTHTYYSRHKTVRALSKSVLPDPASSGYGPSGAEPERRGWYLLLRLDKGNWIRMVGEGLFGRLKVAIAL